MSYYSKYKEKCLLSIKKWREKNHDKILKYKKKYRDNPKNRKTINETQKRYALNHPDKIKAKSTRHQKKTRLLKYGLNQKMFDDIIKSQSGRCKICKNKINNFKIDHDHKTGKVRGLLCNRCNLGLGYFKDSIENLKNAIIYLDEN